VKFVLLHSVEFGEASLGEAPESLDPVGVGTRAGEVIALVNADFIKTSVNQTITTFHSIGMDNAFMTTRPLIMACKV